MKEIFEGIVFVLLIVVLLTVCSTAQAFEPSGFGYGSHGPKTPGFSNNCTTADMINPERNPMCDHVTIVYPPTPDQTENWKGSRAGYINGHLAYDSPYHLSSRLIAELAHSNDLIAQHIKKFNEGDPNEIAVAGDKDDQ